MKTKKVKTKTKLFGGKTFSVSQQLEIEEYRIIIMGWVHNPKYDGDSLKFITSLKPDCLSDHDAMQFVLAVTEVENNPGSNELRGNTFYSREYW